jgi:hypothetical protein
MTWPPSRQTAFASSAYSGLALSWAVIRTTSPRRIPLPPPSAKSTRTDA